MPRAPVHPEGKGQERAEPYTRGRLSPSTHHASSRQSGSSATADRQGLRQNEYGPGHELASRHSQGYDHAQSGVGLPTYLTPYLARDEPDIHHAQPPHASGHISQNPAEEYTKSRALAEAKIAAQVPPFTSEHVMLIRGFAQAADCEGMTAYYGTHGPRELNCREPHCSDFDDGENRVTGIDGARLAAHYRDNHSDRFLFRCFVTQCPKRSDPSHGWNTRSGFINHIKLNYKYIYPTSNEITVPPAPNYGLVPSDPDLYQEQHLHTVGHTLHGDAQGSGEQWHENKSRNLAERHIKGNETLFGKQRIIFIRAFARAADFEQRTAYWGLHGVTHQHCREDNCRAHKHEGPVCKTGLTMDDLIVHYDKEHRGTFLFRCYVDICKSYHEPTHGWNNKSNLVAHVRNENKKKTGLTDPPGPLI